VVEVTGEDEEEEEEEAQAEWNSCSDRMILSNCARIHWSRRSTNVSSCPLKKLSKAVHARAGYCRRQNKKKKSEEIEAQSQFYSYGKIRSSPRKKARSSLMGRPLGCSAASPQSTLSESAASQNRQCHDQHHPLHYSDDRATTVCC
jgi:hypothetical protein